MFKTTARFARDGVTRAFLRGAFNLLASVRRWSMRLERLDDEALRDLGMSRSEIDSFAAEADGRAQRTRRRVAPDFEAIGS